MPTEQGESFTDDPNDPPPPTPTPFPQPLGGILLTQTKPNQGALARGPEPDQSEGMQLEEEEEETGQPQAANQSHVIKNVDEIFHTIEGLMSKLRKLKVSLCSGSTMSMNATTLFSLVIRFLYLFFFFIPSMYI